MKEIFASQSQIGDDIQRHFRNCQKDNLEQKQRRGYVQGRVEILNSLWEEFDQQHQTIDKTISDTERNTHPYYQKGFYGQVKAIYDSYMAYLQKLDTKTGAGVSDETSQAISHEQDISVQLKRTFKLQKAAANQLESLISRIEEREGSQQPMEFYEVMLEALNSQWDGINARNQQIWTECDYDEVDGYTPEVFSALEQRYQETVITLRQMINRLQIPQQNSVVPEATRSEPMRMKLQPMSVPKFDGNYMKWPEFHDLFIQLVHHSNLSNAQKMHFLKDALIGNAERVISHMAITDANYEAAWNIVKSRFSNKRATVTALFDKLFGQPSCKIESANALKDLHDVTQECLLGLQGQQIQTSAWDPFLVYFLLKKVDRATHNLFEQQLHSPRELPCLSEFLKFIEFRFQALEAVGLKSREARETSDKTGKGRASSLITSKTPYKKQIKCIICDANHPIYVCKSFLKLTPEKRYQTIRQAKYCLKCLSKQHRIEECTFKNCPKCAQRHNSLLHFEKQPEATVSGPSQPAVTQSTSETGATSPNMTTHIASRTASTHLVESRNAYVFLATAIVQLVDRHGEKHDFRALLDSGSQVNLITNQAALKLGLKGQNQNLFISGIAATNSKCNKKVAITLHSKANNYSTMTEAYVIPKITTNQPASFINTKAWPIPNNIRLADPEFNVPRAIDLLIGAEIYPLILAVGQIQMPSLPTLQNTLLGWVIQGATTEISTSSFCGVLSSNLDEKLQKYWEMENIPSEGTLVSHDDQLCEDIFHSTVQRNSDGRFVVELPLKISPAQLGESKRIAMNRLLSMERKLSRDPALYKQYDDFLREYIELGHMEEVEAEDIKEAHFFLPHHCVLKPESSTTKLRVVFDGSAKTSSNVSLNDILLVGPKIQDDLFSILLRYRLHNYVFAADISKMYRQILIAEKHRNLQLILWRDVSGVLKTYQLKTVTYGTSSASYLATKCLQKLADIEIKNFPVASSIAKRDFYVDDLLTGSDDLSQALELQRQLRSMLSSGGFQLKKWCANNSRLLEDIPLEDHEQELNIHSSGEENFVKTLGLVWNPKRDEFVFRVSADVPKRLTKRTLASDIAKLFDPLGLLTPVTILAKIFLQQLWQLKIDWDEALPQDIYTRYTRYRSELSLLNMIRIPRHTVIKNRVLLELHGFSDASEDGYGACVYLRSKDHDSNVKVSLLCSKSKVAPLKRQTIARLELAAAKLLVDLMQQVKSSLQANFDSTIYWTDSTIVLSWIARPSSTMKTFVANRVAAIQEVSESNQWRHVPTKHNPADLISRGVHPKLLLKSRLWFQGPDFLINEPEYWPAKIHSVEIIPEEERKSKFILVAGKPTESLLRHIDHHNSFKKLQRIVAYIIRFVKNARLTKEKRKLSENPDATELRDALSFIAKYMQEEFYEDIKRLHHKGHVQPSSTIASLTPFLDADGLIRVGGRIQKSALPYNAKHPILLRMDIYSPN